MSTNAHIRELITRLARIDAAATWRKDVNPAQMSALHYLLRANRFSRSPSHVADYLGTTRGTMSQTLRSLERKGYVSESRFASDRRSMSYELSPVGEKLAGRSGILEDVLGAIPAEDKALLESALSSTILALVSETGGKPFGVCKTCRHHRTQNGLPFCGLLDLTLKACETHQICHEYVR